jgi:hypothetical protein
MDYQGYYTCHPKIDMVIEYRPLVALHTANWNRTPFQMLLAELAEGHRRTHLRKLHFEHNYVLVVPMQHNREMMAYHCHNTFDIVTDEDAVEPIYMMSLVIVEGHI